MDLRLIYHMLCMPWGALVSSLLGPWLLRARRNNPTACCDGSCHSKKATLPTVQRKQGFLSWQVTRFEEDVVRRGEQRARRIERGLDVARGRDALEVRAHEEEHEGQHEPADDEQDDPLHDAAVDGPAPGARPRRVGAAQAVEPPAAARAAAGEAQAPAGPVAVVLRRRGAGRPGVDGAAAAVAETSAARHRAASRRSASVAGRAARAVPGAGASAWAGCRAVGGSQGLCIDRASRAIFLATRAVRGVPESRDRVPPASAATPSRRPGSVSSGAADGSSPPPFVGVRRLRGHTERPSSQSMSFVRFW